MSELADDTRAVRDEDDLTELSWWPSPLGAARAEEDDETARVAIKREELAGIFMM